MYTVIFLHEEIKVGDKLVIEPGNLIVPDGFTAYLTTEKKEKKSVGIIDNNHLAPRAKKCVQKSKFEATVTSITSMNVGNKEGARVALIVPTKEVEEERRLIKIFGTVTKYKARPSLIKKLNDSIEVPLTVENNITYMGDDPVGEVGQDEEIKDNEVVIAVKKNPDFSIDAYIRTFVTKSDKKAVEATEKIEKDIKKKGVEIKEILEYLNKNEIEKDTQVKILNFINQYTINPIKKPENLFEGQKVIKKSVFYTLMDKNILLEGERGIGKNVLAETISWIFQRPLFEFSMNSQHDNTSILGSKSIDVDEKGNMITEFIPETIVKAAEVGGFLVIDEMNTGLAHVFTLLHSLFDHRRRITVPGYKSIEAHPAFRGIATQNRGYVGTFENNEATFDRFVPIVMASSDVKTIEKIIMAKIPNISGIDKSNILTVYKRVKDAIKAGELEESAMTIRGLIDAAQASVEGLDIEEALMDCVANRTQDVDERQKIAEIIAEM